MRHFRSIALLIALTGMFVESALADSVVNGGFETGDFSGWTLASFDPTATAGTTVVFHGAALPLSTQPNEIMSVHSGSFAAALGSFTEVLLSQTLNTNPGTTYILTFFLANCVVPDSCNNNHFAVQWGGSTIFEQINTGPSGYTQFTFSEVASANTTVLTFSSHNVDNWFFLDDVSVIVAPAPFKAFNVNAAIDRNRDAFTLWGDFTLGTGNNGIAPLTEPVQLQIGTFSTTIPAGSFQSYGRGGFTFSGVVNGVSLAIEIEPFGGDSYMFTATGNGANLVYSDPLPRRATLDPVKVGLTIGDDTGSANITPFIL